jgi:D-glycero-D-manno-heptose 1,7-bisphosphate phosphatase
VFEVAVGEDDAARLAQISGRIECLQEAILSLLRMLFSKNDGRARGPAIFLDRDGVINCRRPDDYVLDWSQFVFLPGIREALKQLSRLKLPMIVISNQSGVGKGVIKPQILESITKEMHRGLCADGTHLAAVYYCPHRADENCGCRKPKPGLLLEAAADFNIDLARSVFVGDSETDVQAARAAGCNPVFFDSNRNSQRIDAAVAQTPDELIRVVEKVLQTGANPKPLT